MHSGGPASEASDASHESETRCLYELRESLAATYPAVNFGALSRALRRHGLTSFPEGFLLSNQGSSPREARRALRETVDGRASHPLFSTEFYLLSHPDVRSSGVSAWLHYQVFGRAEGRSPHPFLEPELLSAQIPQAGPDAVDWYVSDPRCWRLECSRYVEIQRFLLSGRWDKYTHPLIDILTHHLQGPWVHRRLAIIDAASDDVASSRLAAAAFLLSGAPASNSPLTVWRHVPLPDRVEGVLTLVPGSLIATEQHITHVHGDTLTPDESIVNLGTESVGLVSADNSRAGELMFIASTAGRRELAALVTEARKHTVISPYDPSQETALRQLRRDLDRPDVRVLKYGNQARLECDRARVLTFPPPSPFPHYDLANRSDSSVTLVLPEIQRPRTTGDPEVRGALADGAALCLVGGHGLNAWLPIIQSRHSVVVDRSLIDSVRHFVPDERIRELPIPHRRFVQRA